MILVFAFLFILPCLSHSVSTRGSCEPSCPLHWLHIPKTASTFCLSLQKAEDETKFLAAVGNSTVAELTLNFTRTHTNQFAGCLKGCIYIRVMGYPQAAHFWHEPLRENESENGLVGFFRNPKDRLISAFLDFYNHDGMNASRFSVIAKTLRHKRPEMIDPIKAIENFNSYRNYLDNSGCQAKLLLGHKCHAYVNISAIMLEKAINQLKSFRFVGIVEYFTLSLELFNKVMGLNSPVHPIQSHSFRQSLYSHEHVKNVTDGVEYHDPFDSIIYEAALMIFKEQLVEFDVPLPSNFPSFCVTDPLDLVHLTNRSCLIH